MEEAVAALRDTVRLALAEAQEPGNEARPTPFSRMSQSIPNLYPRLPLTAATATSPVQGRISAFSRPCGRPESPLLSRNDLA